MTVLAPIPGTLPPNSVPHLRVPFALTPLGSAETVQQGSSDDVTQCVAMLVGTRPGTRMMIPSYGTPDPTFGQINQRSLTAAVALWENRATVTIVVTPGNEEVVSVQVKGGTS